MNSASEDTSLEEWDKTFNVNLRGLFLCCQVSVKCCTGLFCKWVTIFYAFTLPRFNNNLLLIITIKLILVLVELGRDLLYINHRFWSIFSKAAGTYWLPKPSYFRMTRFFWTVVIWHILKTRKLWGAIPNISDYFEKILLKVKRVWNGNGIFPTSAIFIPSFYIKCLKKMC